MDICSRCGYLLIFRNTDGNPHHPYHVPSGWHCWTAGKAPSAPPAEPLAFPDGGERSVDYWEDLKTRGLDAYRSYLKSGAMDEFLSLTKEEIEAGNDRMVRNLLEETLDRFSPGPEQRSLLGQLVVSDAWQQLRDRARPR